MYLILMHIYPLVVFLETVPTLFSAYGDRLFGYALDDSREFLLFTAKGLSAESWQI